MKISLSLVFALLVCAVMSVRRQDFVSGPPGMKNTVVYSGYLDSYQNDRRLHYIFVQSQSNPQTAPLTVWFNGGPGCSSLIGYLQEIGPYLVGNTFKFGQDLTKNQYRWNQASNLLFIEAPGYVGFSTDQNPNITYSDRQTADDNFVALKDFIWKVAPEFTNRSIYLAGQNYAGKFIPDLAVRILNHNRQQNVTYINLKGLLIGNPIMNQAGNSLSKNRIQYMVDQGFISERLLAVYQSACHADFFSPRCEYFKYEFDQIKKNLNSYNVYEVCQKGQTQKIVTEAWIKKVEQKLKQIHNQNKYGKNPEKKIQDLKKIWFDQIPECAAEKGLIDYLNDYKVIYNVDEVKKTWAPCDHNTSYDITVQGSMEEFRQIFLNKGVKVWLYSGDWDDVAPYPDTVYNLNLLGRRKQGHQEPWFFGENHAGFYQLYDSLTLITVKGSGHLVPVSKPAASYQMFFNFINDRPINTPVHLSEQA